MHNGKFEMLSMKQIHQNDIQFLQHSYSLSLDTHTHQRDGTHSCTSCSWLLLL